MLKLMKPTLILTAGAFTLAACTEDPDKTRNGAAIGAAVGLLSGVLTDDDSNEKKSFAKIWAAAALLSPTQATV